MVRYLLILLVIFVAALSANSGFAGTGVCSVSPAGDINFGNYTIMSAVNVDAVGSIQITCDKTQPLMMISISAGRSGGFNPRQMTRGGDATYVLSYYLFTDASRTTLWGDGTGGTSTVMQRVMKDTPLMVSIYGRLPAGQDIAPGSYGDSVTVTITW